MPKNVDFDTGDILPASFLDALNEYLSGSNGGVTLDLSNDTTVVIDAGVDAAQVPLTIGGLWRYITAPTSATDPGGAAGTHYLWAVASANDIEPGDVDNTDYSFGLRITTSTTPPTGTHGGAAIAATRMLARLYWDGSAIYGIDSFVGSSFGPQLRIAKTATQTPVRVRGAGSQTAPLLIFEDSAGVVLGSIKADGKTLAPAGSVAAPSVAFQGDQDTGLFSLGADQVGVSAGGTTRLKVTTTTVEATVTLVNVGTQIYRNGSGDALLQLGRNTSADATVGVSSGSGNISTESASGDLVVRTANSSQAVRINSGAAAGITVKDDQVVIGGGAADAGLKLHVKGAAKFTGNVDAGAFTVAGAGVAGAVFLAGIFASRPSAASVAAGTMYWATDSGGIFRSDGTNWIFVEPAKPGDIKLSGRGSADTGWVLCDGTSYPVGSPGSTYYQLHQAIGYAFGGAGANFNVPDYRGRGPLGASLPNNTGTGLTSRAIGAKVGAETHTLTGAESGVNGSGSTASSGPWTTTSFSGQMGYFSQSFGSGTDSPPGHPFVIWGPGSVDISSHMQHSHTVPAHSHNLVARDASSAHNNVHPSQVCLFQMKL